MDNALRLFSQLKFWVLVVALLTYVITFFVPTFPFDQDSVLKFILFVLGLFGIEAEVKYRRLVTRLMNQGVLSKGDSEHLFM